MEELAALREMLAGAEEDLTRYKAFRRCGDQCLEANYARKEAQIAELKRRIEKIEKGNET